ncbi:MAG TPA: sigma 54-interacting transcriptional regulator [Desulfosporosinus sp.]|nr:sigma 54-interacting transcriptional regulator [Desulfosporosinus sp.]
MELIQKDKPLNKIVLTSAYPELTALVREMAYKLKIELTVVEAVLEEALDEVRRLNEHNEVEVLVSRGATAELLRSKFSLPIISVAPNEFDILWALAQAKAFSSTIGYFSSSSLTDIEFLLQVQSILNVVIKHYPYSNMTELSAQMEQAYHDECEVVVGGGHRGIRLAKAFGMEGFLIYSSQSTVSGALTRAAEIVSLRSQKRSEEERQRRISQANGLIAHYSFQDLVGPALMKTILTAKRFSKVDATVLIWGESGTGKELFAQSIHNASPRCHGPFVALNCASITETLLESELFGYEEGAFTGAKKGGKTGLFELANGGTIFFDEIGKMSLNLQAGLLRVLQTKEVRRVGGGRYISVDIRVIAASNQNLQAEVDKGNFRDDLFYRLNVLNLYLLPLRSRRADIPCLIDSVKGRLEKKLGFCPAISPQFRKLLLAYNWPGNVRELENILERYAVLVGEEEQTLHYELIISFPELQPLEKEALDDFTTVRTEVLFEQNANIQEKELIRSISVQPGTLAEMEGQLIRVLLEYYKGNKTMVAATLGISRTTLWKRCTDNELY